jgi:formylmethanofuran dehydrogenase subunit A
MKMSEVLIKNACVCDPVQGINCETMDICIRDGRIVESVSQSAKVIDAEGKLTMAGGFDGHTHSAGKINVGRFMNPNDARKNPVPGLSGQVARTEKTRAQVGYNTPNTYAIGYRYAKLGYTTIARLREVEKPGKLANDLNGYNKKNKLGLAGVSPEAVAKWLQ